MKGFCRKGNHGQRVLCLPDSPEFAGAEANSGSKQPRVSVRVGLGFNLTRNPAQGTVDAEKSTDCTAAQRTAPLPEHCLVFAPLKLISPNPYLRPSNFPFCSMKAAAAAPKSRAVWVQAALYPAEGAPVCPM